MGASRWASCMAGRLKTEFGTSDERNTRITSLFRIMVSDPKYKPLSEELPHDRRDEWQLFHNDLPKVLRDQPGGSIEDRWNSLMDELGYPELVDPGVYLIPWDDFEGDPLDAGVTQKRP